MTCAPNEDSDQPGHPPRLIRVFAVCMKKPWVLSFPLSAQRRLWSDWVSAQADLSLCWVHRSFCCFCLVAAQIWIHLDMIVFFNFRKINNKAILSNSVMQILKKIHLIRFHYLEETYRLNACCNSDFCFTALQQILGNFLRGQLP